MITSHPNAETSIYTGALSVLILYGVGFEGVHPPAEVGAALTTVLTGLVLLAGRRGAKPDAGGQSGMEGRGDATGM